MFNLIAQAIQSGGVGAVFALMLVENVIPVIPSEIILPMAGYAAAQGRMNASAAVIASAAASVMGAWVWYAAGRALGLERVLTWAGRHGRWLTLTPDEVRRADAVFHRWGALAVAVGRALPGVRGVISLPAGVARLAPGAFLVACTAGSLAWSAMLVYAGFALRTHFTQVERWLNPATTGFLLLCAAVYLARAAMFRKR